MSVTEHKEATSKGRAFSGKLPPEPSRKRKRRGDEGYSISVLSQKPGPKIKAEPPPNRSTPEPTMLRSAVALQRLLRLEL
jgi:hypothetical protein